MSTPRRIDLGRGWSGLELSSSAARVVLLPEKGADIYTYEWSALDGGLDVLAKTPWGLPPSTPGAAAQNSVTAFLERYAGGWQLLLPNGGDESRGPGGVRWGFHGEAAVVAWDVDDSGPGDDGAWVELSVRLHRAPLQLHRRVELDGADLSVTDTVRNTSPDPLEFMWSHHPAYGPPFLEAGCTISTGARTFTADGKAPGTVFAADAGSKWPNATTRDGAAYDLSVVPSVPTELMGYLTDFDGPVGWYAFHNPRLALGVALRWPTATFGAAWFWQELNASPGYPWWREAFIAAIEPASSIPGNGVDGVRAAGGTLISLDGGAERTATVEARLFESADAPASMRDVWPD